MLPWRGVRPSKMKQSGSSDQTAKGWDRARAASAVAVVYFRHSGLGYVEHLSQFATNERTKRDRIVKRDLKYDEFNLAHGRGTITTRSRLCKRSRASFAAAPVSPCPIRFPLSSVFTCHLPDSRPFHH